MITRSEIADQPVTTVGETAIYACQKLTGFVIPDSVTTIEDGGDDFGRDDDQERGPFMLCRSLTKISIPPGVTSVGD